MKIVSATVIVHSAIAVLMLRWLRAVIIGAVRDCRILAPLPSLGHPLPKGARDKILQRHGVRPLGLEQSVGLQIKTRVFLFRFTFSFYIAIKRKSEQKDIPIIVFMLSRFVRAVQFILRKKKTSFLRSPLEFCVKFLV